MAVELGISERAIKVLRLWHVIAILLATGLFAQAIFAGAMLSGIDWARGAHKITAVTLIGSTIASGFAAGFFLRHIRNGLKFSLMLLSLAVLLFLQILVGTLSSKGANLLWIHVPLGVALVGFAAQTAKISRQLGVKK